MAHYIKYEIFLPVDYTDRATGERRALDRSFLLRFLFQTVRRYSGLTETNPITAPPFKDQARNLFAQQQRANEGKLSAYLRNNIMGFVGGKGDAGAMPAPSPSGVQAGAVQ
ncbi:MAG: hypothetical protein NZT92_01625 [Abditibacteriales bacterium]|nr:hypothetical protein [Abditibacteriales bacterium]MDW8367501.1 hypothetical protein [Abditibacteriales bacterium]